MDYLLFEESIRAAITKDPWWLLCIKAFFAIVYISAEHHIGLNKEKFKFKSIVEFIIICVVNLFKSIFNKIKH